MPGENDPNVNRDDAPELAPLELHKADPSSAAQTRETAQQAMDRLNQSNRLLVEARMLPRSKPLTDEQINEVKSRFKAYKDRPTPKITLAQVARECGYSETVISEWLSGKYNGDVSKVSHAINDWMERDARRAMAQRPKDFVPTQVAENIRGLVSLVDKRCMIAVIVVPAGAGKTKVLKILNEQMRGVYLYCDQQLTPREFLRSLADALGRKSRHATKAELQRWIVQTLAGTNRIVFLDEAHQLGAALNCVRSIHDQAHVPIVMAGTADILQHVNDRSDGRGQFSSRCVFYNAMDSVADAERPGGGESGGRNLFSLDEIRAFFDMKKIRLADDALELCWALACLPNYGTLRLIENTIEAVVDMEPEVEVITRGQVRRVLAIMVGEPTTKYLTRIAVRHQEISKVA